MATERPPSHPVFLAIGGLWLDEIHVPNKTVVKDVVGGTIIFATLGARIFADSPDVRRRIRMIFVAGHDFPISAFATWRDWMINVTTHWDNEHPAARIRIDYESADLSQRRWERLTAPLTTSWRHLSLPDITHTGIFHFFETPSDFEEQVSSLRAARKAFRQSSGEDAESPTIIWEPQAKSCAPAFLAAHVDAARLADVFSPNHIELARFFAASHADAAATLVSSPETFSKATIEEQARYFLTQGRLKCVVVRAAENGCLVMTSTSDYTQGHIEGGDHRKAHEPEVLQGSEAVWLPAYHSTSTPPEEKARVIDPTGAGNSFLGGFAIGFHETGSFVTAAMYGSIAASFVIEQVGLPSLSASSTSRQGSSSEAEHERWNGEVARERLRRYQERVTGTMTRA